jgi:hypothetical protein
VHDVLLVAIVDAGKNLFHENSGIAFGEFATLQDFVEQLTTLADPMIS